MPSDEYKKKISEIAEIASDILNDWEIDFIESVSKCRRELSHNQKVVVDRLYKRACNSEH